MLKSIFQKLRFYLKPKPKIKPKNLKKLAKFRKIAQLLTKHRKLYALRRLDDETVQNFGLFAKEYEEEINYITEVLTYEFLNDNIWANQRERDLIKQAGRLLRNFLIKQCK